MHESVSEKIEIAKEHIRKTFSDWEVDKFLVDTSEFEDDDVKSGQFFITTEIFMRGFTFDFYILETVNEPLILTTEDGQLISPQTLWLSMVIELMDEIWHLKKAGARYICER